MQWSYRVEGDDATRTATVYDQYNNVVETRPYTDLENAAADARALNDTRAENEATLNSGLSEQIDNAIARKDAMAAIKAMTNADINANPARHIKDVADAVRLTNGALVRVMRLVGGLTETTDGA